MFSFSKIFGSRNRADAPEPTPAPPPDPRNFLKPEHFSVTATDLMTDEASLKAAFATAVAKAEAGEPYGVALYFAVRNIARNSQFVDEMIDELPNWAFGDQPGEHFAFMVHHWARATESGEKAQHNTFKKFAILGGWRPGDANAYWLDYRIGTTPPLPDAGHDPLGRDHLGGELIVAPSEMRVYMHLSAEAEKLQRPAGHA